ncbi:hypothetical protein GGR58DRAFT_494970 [Xylaria digitata]|nr:hypothetical protein GGR58DRAFT_494970 [Xylaria digitata]
MAMMNDITVYQYNTGNGDGADMMFDMNGQRIAISFFPSSQAPRSDLNPNQSESCIEDSIIQRLGQATITKEDDEREEIIDQVLAIILDVGKPIFAEVAPVNKAVPLPPSQDLQSFLYPKTLTYRLKTAGGNPAIIPIDLSETYSCLEPKFDNYPEIDFEIDESLPQYSPQQISVLEAFVQTAGHLVGRVRVHEKEMLCKVRSHGLLHPDLEREIENLQKMRRAGLHGHTSMRVPQILGYVKHSEVGCIIGFLREWVPGDDLRNIRIPVTLEKKRMIWASQISKTVHQLHEIGVIWGDGKARNVIIDEEDNAWLIDFGGGFTDGWVEKELAGTVEGDKQAVQKIVDFLGVEYQG